MNTGKRTFILIGALAALLPLGALTTEATGLAVTTSVSGGGTPIDAAIDAAVQRRVASGNVSAPEAATYREQLQIQFLSLSPAARQSIVAAAREANTATGLVDVLAMLRTATKAEAEQALAVVQSAQQAQRTSELQKGLQPKLGPIGPDLVFVATVGPCRVFDSRFGPGPLGGGAARQIFGWSNGAGYSWAADQGGTGTAGSGNCVGTVYPGVSPVAVVATVAVVNTFSTGSMRAWNGGATLTVGGILGWNAGDVLSNTTVIPMDRTIPAYPNSGAKRDFGIFNNSSSPVDFIIDVVGYFIENVATALDCTTVTSSSFPIAANANALGASPACAAGYTRVVTTCFPSNFFDNLVGVSDDTCFFRSESASATSFTATSVCCRVPGR